MLNIYKYLMTLFCKKESKTMPNVKITNRIRKFSTFKKFINIANFYGKSRPLLSKKFCF